MGISKRTAMGVLGIDFGGTQIRAGLVTGDRLMKTALELTPSTASEPEVLKALFSVIDQFKEHQVDRIGIGVPSVVDVKAGIVYDVQNIPLLKEVPLKAHLESKYGVPVLVNNDANCFVLGEKYFGKGKAYENIVGLTLGTGLGGGVIIHDRLYMGANCGAGEFGMVAYLKYNYEYYASGQSFENLYQTTGTTVYEKARSGDPVAQDRFTQFGYYLAEAIKMVLYTYDPQVIIFGGSVKKAFDLFEKPMWERLHKFAYTHSLKKLKIVVSELDHSGILGAVALWHDFDRIEEMR